MKPQPKKQDTALTQARRLMQRMIAVLYDKDCSDAATPARLTPLLAESADIPGAAGANAKDSTGIPLLTYAIMAGKLKGAEFLIDRGADVCAVDPDGDTPLITAALWNREAIAKMLIRKGAAIDGKDDCGCTALIWAVRSHADEVAIVLMDAGANLECRDYMGFNAEGHAVKENNIPLLGLLQDARAKAREKERLAHIRSAGDMRTTQPVETLPKLKPKARRP